MPRFIKPLVFILCLLPLLLLVWRAFHGALGANPIEKVTHVTGLWTLRFLLLTLAITPLRKILGWRGLLRLRRMLGLYTFFYACLHFLTYLVLDQFFDFGEIVRDVIKRPYITVGFTAFILTIPLAVTSTNAMMKRLGKRWKQLHQIVYLIAVLAIFHFLWLVKADNFDPLVYGSILLLLFGARLWLVQRDRSHGRLANKNTRASGFLR